MPRNSLNNRFHHDLCDVLSTVKQLVKALPQIANGSTLSELRQGFELHLDQTKIHIERLLKVYEATGQTARAKTCEAMKSLIGQNAENIKVNVELDAKNAVLIGPHNKETIMNPRPAAPSRLVCR